MLYKVIFSVGFDISGKVVLEATKLLEEGIYFNFKISNYAESGFYLENNGLKQKKENFFGGKLQPINIFRKNSPWIGKLGGIDYLVDKEYLHEIIKKHFNIEPENNYPYVDIPQDERKLGTFMSYMGWHQITLEGSEQLALKKDAYKNNRYSIAKPEYYAMIDNRILIATKKNIGDKLEVSIGDYVDVTFQKDNETPLVYKCIIGDEKFAGAESSSWGHYDGKGVVEIIYNDFNPPEGYNIVNVPVKAGNNPWGKGKILRITKVGNYYN